MRIKFVCSWKFSWSLCDVWVDVCSGCVYVYLIGICASGRVYGSSVYMWCISVWFWEICMALCGYIITLQYAIHGFSCNSSFVHTRIHRTSIMLMFINSFSWLVKMCRLSVLYADRLRSSVVVILLLKISPAVKLRPKWIMMNYKF